jgi:hypothetical protein
VAGREAGVEYGQDVGVMQPGLGADLALEPFHAECLAQAKCSTLSATRRP